MFFAKLSAYFVVKFPTKDLKSVDNETSSVQNNFEKGFSVEKNHGREVIIFSQIFLIPSIYQDHSKSS